MSQANKETETSDAVQTIETKESPTNFMKKRSILDRDYESEEEIAVTMDDAELKVSTKSGMPKAMEVFTSLAYCSENQTLCAGTNQGNLYLWKRNTPAMQAAISGIQNGTNGFDSMENFWHLYNIANVRGAIKFCSWGICDVSTPCVLVNCVSNVYILKVNWK